MTKKEIKDRIAEIENTRLDFGELSPRLKEELQDLKKILKDGRIKKEIVRLRKIFADLDRNKMDAVDSLITNAAFMRVSLDDLQEEINRSGYTCEYQNGANQSGTKKSPEMDMYISMSKNHAAVIKILADLAPPAKRKESKLAAMRDGG